MFLEMKGLCVCVCYLSMNTIMCYSFWWYVVITLLSIYDDKSIKTRPKDIDPRIYLQVDPISWTRMLDTLISVVMVKKGSHRSSIWVSLKTSSISALKPKPDIIL